MPQQTPEVDPRKEAEFKTWSNEKFRRLIERFREDGWCQPQREVSDHILAYAKEMEEAFKRLHPRAYQNWLNDLRSVIKKEK